MLKVLIAEDELIIADLLEETLINGGFEVCGIARTVDEAVALAERHRPDLAVLDFRLAHGGRGPDIAARVSAQRVGILYATGTDTRNGGMTCADGVAFITKPYRGEDILRALAIVNDIMTSGSSTRSAPAGFHLLPDSEAPSRQARPR